MSRRNRLLFGVWLSVCACGGDVDHPGESGSSDPGAGGGVSSAEGPASSAEMAASSSGAGGAGDCLGQGAAEAFSVEFNGRAVMSLGCKPSSPPDVSASVVVRYNNEKNPVISEAHLPGARIALEDGSPIWTFELEPPGSGPVAPCASVEITHSDAPGSGVGVGAGSPCDHCGSFGALEIDVQIDGQGESTIAFPMTLACAL